ncbi:hypothetical protein EVAR_33126_1 [Eumeta japonica]|uniref:Uncharacterized protein n=1 Tax=Eumeta variegata TaxID=151549 RepID=A0A4C1Y8S5_EUMVA|nr:hypothetical protein EVAR_33126_1 [Eumeta japonica]
MIEYEAREHLPGKSARVSPGRRAAVRGPQPYFSPSGRRLVLDVPNRCPLCFRPLPPPMPPTPAAPSPPAHELHSTCRPLRLYPAAMMYTSYVPLRLMS